MSLFHCFWGNIFDIFFRVAIFFLILLWHVKRLNRKELTDEKPDRNQFTEANQVELFKFEIKKDLLKLHRTNPDYVKHKTWFQIKPEPFEPNENQTK